MATREIGLAAPGLSATGISYAERQKQFRHLTLLRNYPAPMSLASPWTSGQPALICSLIVSGICLLTGICFGSAALKPIEMVPWLVSLGFVGLPHGAADLAVLRAGLEGKSMTRFFAAYSLGLAAMTVLLVVYPNLLMASFMLFSLWHFGHADTAATGRFDHWFLTVATSFYRCGVILGCALTFWSRVVAALVADASSLLHPIRMLFGLSALSAHPVTIEHVRLTGLLVLALSGLAGLIRLIFFCFRSNFNDLREQDFQTVLAWILLAGLSLVAPPLLSVGLMFLLWHAGQQIPLIAKRLGASESASPAQHLLLVHRAALPLLIPAWLALGLAWHQLSPTHSLHDLTLLSILMYLVVTPSHELLCVCQEWFHSRRPPWPAS